MQIIRYFKGTEELEEGESRPFVYGGDATSGGKSVWRYNPTTGDRYRVFISTPVGQTNFLNKTIAGFLKSDCGVDAEWREDGDGVKWLFIENIPFLFYVSGDSIGVYHPCVLHGGLASRRIYHGAPCKWSKVDTDSNTIDYDFGLIFSGKAGHGWCLRLSGYNFSGGFAQHGTQTISGFLFCYYTAKHIPTNNDGAIVTGKILSVSGTGARPSNVTAIQVSGGKVVESSVFFGDRSDSDPTTYLSVQAGGNDANWYICDDKIPLIPITCGLYQAVGCYKHIKGMHIPDATTARTAAQTEVFVGNKILMNTCTDSMKGQCINMGLIDVT